jgi:hypothetical protein
VALQVAAKSLHKRIRPFGSASAKMEIRIKGAARTNVPAEAINAANTVSAYKSLARVERAFRSVKTVDPEIRPIYH